MSWIVGAIIAERVARAFGKSEAAKAEVAARMDERQEEMAADLAILAKAERDRQRSEEFDRLDEIARQSNPNHGKADWS